MTKLLIPVCGKSSRYGTSRPKWLLAHPSGNLMITESIKKLDLNNFSEIIITHLEEHLQFNFKNRVIDEISKLGIIPVKFLSLKSSNSVVETIKKTIEKLNIVDPIFIKDSDNSFDVQLNFNDCSFVCVSKINESKINYANKSFVEFNHENILTNIQEKKIISDCFVTGGYFIKNPKIFEDFIINDDEKYISDIIKNMIDLDEKVLINHVKNYLDWGTIEDWNEYKRQFKTLFIDIDGVLFNQPSDISSTYNIEYNENNLNYIKNLSLKENIKIIFTTARGNNQKLELEQKLSSDGIKFEHIITGLFHSERVIINDYSDTNPYPTCSAINIKRNDDNIKNILRL